MYSVVVRCFLICQVMRAFFKGSRTIGRWTIGRRTVGRRTVGRETVTGWTLSRQTSIGWTLGRQGLISITMTSMITLTRFWKLFMNVIYYYYIQFLKHLASF